MADDVRHKIRIVLWAGAEKEGEWEPTCLGHTEWKHTKVGAQLAYLAAGNTVGAESNLQRRTSVLDLLLCGDIIQCMLNYIPASGETPTPPTDLQALAARLKVLAEPKRLLILHMLIEGVQCNCELGGALQMPPNLTSHHLRILREAGLVNVERDALDARWVYYSVNRQALDELNAAFGVFFDPGRIKPRRLTCGPQGTFVRMDEITTQK